MIKLLEDGNREAAQALVASGADVNERSVDGTTPLHWAAHYGDADLLQQLIAEGADATLSNDYGATPISVAAIIGERRIIELLLDAGADVDSYNAEGESILMVVARTGQIDTARLLVERGADVNATEHWGGQSALMWAAAQNQPEMVRELIEHGANIDARGKIHDWERRVTAEPRVKIMEVGGFTPLLYAARAGCVECARLLLEAGADPDLSDPYGITPLVLALLNLRFDTAAVLIEHGADVNQWDWWGRSPLYAAIDLNTLPRGGRIDLPSLDKLTGFDIARMLLERGANPDMRLKKDPPSRHPTGDRGTYFFSSDGHVLSMGATALHRAAKASDDEAIKLLLEYGANLHPRNVVMGITPFLAAAGVAHLNTLTGATRGRFKTSLQAIESMKILLAAGANINDRTLDGSTAAHGAAEMGWSEVIQYLYDQGFDINTPNDNGETPRDIALRNDRIETLAVFDKLLAK